MRIARKDHILKFTAIALTALLAVAFSVSNSAAERNYDLDINASLVTSYDDNVTLSNNKTDDFVTNLSMGLGFSQAGKTHSVALEGNLIQHFYAKNSTFNNISEDMKFTLEKEFSGFDKVKVADRFVHAQEPTNFEASFGTQYGRYSYKRNNLEFTYSKELSKYIAVVPHYKNVLYYTAPDRIIDSVSHTVGFDLDYILDSALKYILGYDFTNISLNPGDSARAHTVVPGFKYFFTKQLSLETRAGVSFVDSYDGSQSAEPSFILSLNDDISATESAKITFEKANIPSSYDRDTFDLWRVSMNLNRRLSERLAASGYFFYGHGEYNLLDVKDNQLGISGQLSYDLTKDAKTFFRYSFTQVDSNQESRTYVRNLVELGARVSF